MLPYSNLLAGKKMRIGWFLAASIFFMLSCLLVDISQTPPEIAPLEASSVGQGATSTPVSSRMPSPSFMPQATAAVTIPAWVVEFSNPILEYTAGRDPDYEDRFLINRGWYYVASGNRPVLADRQDQMLALRLPADAQIRDAFVYNPTLARENFVLSLELRFDHAQVDDTVQFEFGRQAGTGITFELTNSDNWNIHWNFNSGGQSRSGTFEHFPPEKIPVTFIVLGGRCAVYLNNVPLVYLNDCRPANRVAELSHPAVTFHALTTARHDLTVVFDNLKLWDLDKPLFHIDRQSLGLPRAFFTSSSTNGRNTSAMVVSLNTTVCFIISVSTVIIYRKLSGIGRVGRLSVSVKNSAASSSPRKVSA
jgi:hypothetical protein